MRAASAGASTSAAISSPGLPGPKNRPGLIGLVGQQVAADQVHAHASAGEGPEVQTRLDRFDRPAAGVDLITRPGGERERQKPERVEDREVLRPCLRLVTDPRLGAPIQAWASAS